MKRYICLLAGIVLFVACEQKQTTVNPPAEKKESNTTVVNPPAEKKETQTTVINPATETKKEKTEVNINASPKP
jgi:PBP1b-binding outer membrane lipoprotein LpoB